MKIYSKSIIEYIDKIHLSNVYYEKFHSNKLEYSKLKELLSEVSYFWKNNLTTDEQDTIEMFYESLSK